MAKYVYPAVFKKEEKGGYFINFPDFEACFTQGEDLQDGLDMAEDVLCLTLYDMERNGVTPPRSSEPQMLNPEKDEFVTLVGCDTVAYERYFHNKAVKKTLSIPQWLDDVAKKEHVNFSGVLQEALMEKLGIDKKGIK